MTEPLIPPVETPLADDDLQALKTLSEIYQSVRAELGKVIVGQDAVVTDLLLAVFARGHCILEGVPGLAKTLIVSTLGRCMDLSFSRVQFTPDLMPSDITGTEVLQEDKATGERLFKFLPGPVFANLVLADEINRTPPKTQAALLEAMQERQITIGGKRYAVPDPFFVLATQNPIEQEGTYPLPEAQQDRFMFKILVGYPDFAEEYRIAESTTSLLVPEIRQVITADKIIELQRLIRRIPVAPHCIVYALRLVRATRLTEEDVPDFIRNWVSWGAGPRAVQNLLLGAKARAAFDGRTFVSPADIRSVAHPVLRHRILTNFSADSEGVTPDTIIDQLLEHIAADEGVDTLPPEVARAFAKVKSDG